MNSSGTIPELQRRDAAAESAVATGVLHRCVERAVLKNGKAVLLTASSPISYLSCLLHLVVMSCVIYARAKSLYFKKK